VADSDRVGIFCSSTAIRLDATSASFTVNIT
jgi:hypothetical protein